MIAQTISTRRRGIPNYVCGTDNGRQGIDTFSFGSAYLGNSVHPFVVPGDPSAENFKIDNLAPSEALVDRLDDRVALLDKFDTWRRRADKAGSMDALDEFNRRALELVTSEKARKAFDLTQEPEAVRERYGKHAYGQRALMARLLSGVTFVTMVMENPQPSRRAAELRELHSWDSHAVVHCSKTRKCPAVRSGGDGVDRLISAQIAACCSW
jgi:hypothetical protein